MFFCSIIANLSIDKFVDKFVDNKATLYMVHTGKPIRHVPFRGC